MTTTTETMQIEVSPPGELIAEELEARGWSQQALAEILGVSPTLVSEVINAKRAITPETAALLGHAFGTSTEVWLGLDARYQASLAKTKKAASTALRSKLYAKAPVRALIRRGWIKEERDPAKLSDRVLKFLEQSSLDDNFIFDHAARKSTAYGITTPQQFAWLCRARHLSRIVSLRGKWRQSRAAELVSELRQLAAHAEGVRDVPRLLSEYGIRLVVLERLSGMKMDGATFWLDEDSPVIAHAARFDRIDNFWQTLLHEVGHVENNDRLAVDEEVLSPGTKPEPEIRADKRAVESLIPQDRLDDFCLRAGPFYSKIRILGFASLIGVHPGIVVGQLHKRGPENRGLAYTHLRNFLVPIRKLISQHALTDGWGRTVEFND